MVSQRNINKYTLVSSSIVINKVSTEINIFITPNISYGF